MAALPDANRRRGKVVGVIESLAEKEVGSRFHGYRLHEQLQVRDSRLLFPSQSSLLILLRDLLLGAIEVLKYVIQVHAESKDIWIDHHIPVYGTNDFRKDTGGCHRDCFQQDD